MERRDQRFSYNTVQVERSTRRMSDSCIAAMLALCLDLLWVMFVLFMLSLSLNRYLAKV